VGYWKKSHRTTDHHGVPGNLGEKIKSINVAGGKTNERGDWGRWEKADKKGESIQTHGASNNTFEKSRRNQGRKCRLKAGGQGIDWLASPAEKKET